MIIDKIGGINPLSNVQGSQRVSARSSVFMGGDSISVSREAQEMAEAYYLSEIAASTPDVRSDLVAKVKDKIKDPNYINSAVIGNMVGFEDADVLFIYSSLLINNSLGLK